jgi:uncharacterized protein YgiM (DUF1202 family)
VTVLALSYLISRKTVAIVNVKQATVHLGPVAESQAAFTVTDGSELGISARRPGWYQVTNRSNRSGWISVTNALMFPGEYRP